MQKKKLVFSFAFLLFFCNFATTWRKYNALGIKNKFTYFVLLSFFCIFVNKTTFITTFYYMRKIMTIVLAMGRQNQIIKMKCTTN